MRLLPRGWPRAPGKHLNKTIARGRKLSAEQKHLRRALVLTEEITPRSLDRAVSRFLPYTVYMGSRLGWGPHTPLLSWIISAIQGPLGQV